MGLLYAFPVSLEETDFAELKDNTLSLKTYGLPYIFWGYATAVVLVIFFMFMAIHAPILKLIELGDETDAMLGYALLIFIGILPMAIFGFFFFEKRLIREPGMLSMEYRVFRIKFFSETFQLESGDSFSIDAFLDSPNMARLKGGEDSAGFQNKGYFTLNLKSKEGKNIQIDRSSRKADLIKILDLLRLIP
jgi:hypothetical protein